MRVNDHLPLLTTNICIRITSSRTMNSRIIEPTPTATPIIVLLVSVVEQST